MAPAINMVMTTLLIIVRMLPRKIVTVVRKRASTLG